MSGAPPAHHGSIALKAECLEYALEHDERFGIWGGLSERERRRLKSARKLAA
jgi:WhiB family transcriptional regulator, redox-sensing transcriptional regulator